MGTLDIKLFGALRVQRSGRPVSRFPTKRVKDLFSYLLLNRHTLHSREALADLFWDGSKEHNPRHCLNTALWRLNRTLGESEPGEHPYLRIDAQCIGFNTASDCRLDVAEFENRCLWAEQVGPASPEQQATLYHQATTLYQADLLVDCYEEWCLVERERLRQIYLRALDHLVDYHEARNEHLEAIDCAMRLLACEPLREDMHRKLMRFCLATHQPTVALRQYQACQSVLHRELGTAPSPETKALLPEIFRHTGLGPEPGGAPAIYIAPVLPNAPGGHAELTAAVARLDEAVAAFDRAQAQLREAAVSVEDLAHRLLAGDLAQPAPSRLCPAEPAAVQVQRAARLVAGAARRVEPDGVSSIRSA